MPFAAQPNAIPQCLEVMHEALRARLDLGMIRIRPAPYRVQAGVHLLACRCTHGRRCIRHVKPHPLASQPVDVWRLHILIAVDANAILVQVICDHDQYVWLPRRLRLAKRCRQKNRKRNCRKCVYFRSDHHLALPYQTEPEPARPGWSLTLSGLFSRWDCSPNSERMKLMRTSSCVTGAGFPSLMHSRNSTSSRWYASL